MEQYTRSMTLTINNQATSSESTETSEVSYDNMQAFDSLEIDDKVVSFCISGNDLLVTFHCMEWDKEIVVCADVPFAIDGLAENVPFWGYLKGELYLNKNQEISLDVKSLEVDGMHFSQPTMSGVYLDSIKVNNNAPILVA
ncbi:MAG: hypothetical protein ACRCXZ_09115 [Patescibacteria group bacterium]